MTFVEITVTDEAATRFAKGLQNFDLHAEACCIQVLIRDRKRLLEQLDAIRLELKPEKEGGHTEMSETTWAMIREAMERVISGAARRQDLDLCGAKISVYRVGSQIRCDVTPYKEEQ